MGGTMFEQSFPVIRVKAAPTLDDLSAPGVYVDGDGSLYTVTPAGVVTVFANDEGPGTTSFNVKTYGATGNGTTDDTSSINSAITALNANGGGTLFFPWGTYNISSDLTSITVPAIICADSPGTTIHATVLNLDMITITTGNSVVRDLTFLCNASGTPSSGAAIRFTLPSVAYNMQVVDCVIAGTYYGIRLNDYCILANIYANEIIDTFMYGIWREYDGHYYDNGDDAYSMNSIVTGAGLSGSAAIRLDAHGGPKITANKIGGTFDYGIQVAAADPAEGDATATGGLLISNNSIEGPAVAGIALARSGTTGAWELSQIVGNEFESSESAILLGDGIENVVISGNVGGGSSYGVNIVGATSAVEIDGNVFIESTVGVNVGSTATLIDIGRSNIYHDVTTPIAIADGATLAPQPGITTTSGGVDGTTSGTFVMAGLDVNLTPLSTANVMAMITGTATSSSGDGGVLAIMSGTGTPPTNGAALTGTYRTAEWNVQPGSAGGASQFSLVTSIPATDTWFDIAFASTSGTLTLTDITIAAG